MATQFNNTTASYADDFEDTQDIPSKDDGLGQPQASTLTPAITTPAVASATAAAAEDHQDIRSKGEGFGPPQDHQDIRSKGEGFGPPQDHQDIRSKGEGFGPPQAPASPLHLAAREGHVESVRSLLAARADPKERDENGQTALDVAEAHHHTEVSAALREVEDAERARAREEAQHDAELSRPAALREMDATRMPAEAQNEKEVTRPLHEIKEAHPAKEAEAPANTAPSPLASPAHSTMDPARTGQSPAATPNQSTLAKTQMSTSMPLLGHGDYDYKDIKQKTEFASVTCDGVLKRATYMTSISNFRTSPKFSLGARGESAFIRSSTTPAPGSYNMPVDEKVKYKGVPKYSFGGSSRFGLAAPPTKRQPGPGAYNPRDPANEVATKVGFSTSIRNKGALMSQANPGPGAYEFRSSIGQGKMFTARGRYPTSYARSRSQPGPGAYTPMTNNVQGAAPKCGFGTSTRTDVISAARSAVLPGPGTYELQSFRSTGADAPKYSATSRRRVHDLNSYVTPGPGSYNSHTTSFGY